MNGEILGLAFGVFSISMSGLILPVAIIILLIIIKKEKFE